MVGHAVPEPDTELDGFTIEDWLAWEGYADLRVELIDGAYVVNPAPSPRHQWISHQLMDLLSTPLKGAGLTAWVSGGGVILPGMGPGQGLIPDIMAVPLDIDIDDLTVLQGADVVLAVGSSTPGRRSPSRPTSSTTARTGGQKARRETSPSSSASP